MMAQRTRIAYILTPITFGGAEKVSLNFLRAVNRECYDVRPILLVRPWEEELYFGRELRRMGYDYDSVPVALKTDGDPLRIPRVAYRLYAYLKNGTFDLVHTHGYFADICGQFAARLAGIDGISTCHGFIDADLKLKLYIRLDKIILRLCKKVIAVSEVIKTELIASGISDSRVAVLPNAVAILNREGFRARGEKKRIALGIHLDDCVIGYLGRLSEEKGVAYLVEAVAALSDKVARVKLVIVGDGPEKVRLERQVKANGLSGKVVFAGFRTDIENWYPAFDVFALPSLTEGTPLALLEAMAAGVPVVASATGGVPGIITDCVNGILVQPGNPGMLKEKLYELLVDSELSRRLGEAGIRTVTSRYSIDKWCRAIENCYRRG